MFASIDWGQVLLTVALIVGAIALIYSRLKPETRQSLTGYMRRGKKEASESVHKTKEHAPTPGPAHEHDGHDHHGHGATPRPIVATIIILIAIGIMVASLYFSIRSPSPSTVSEAIRERWLLFLLAVLLLNIGAAFADDKWQLKRIVLWATVFIVGIGLFGPLFDGGKRSQRSLQAGAGQPVLHVPTRPANGRDVWTVFTAPTDDQIAWVLTADGHTLSICDPEQSPNCDRVDPATLRYKRWCRIGSDEFPWDSGKCVIADAVGVQSMTGKSLVLVYKDVPNGGAKTEMQLAETSESPPEPEAALESEETVPAPPPEPVLEKTGRPATEPKSYGQPMNQYVRESF